MTLDKFGRHIIKHQSRPTDKDVTVSRSQHLFYTMILTFNPRFISDNVFVLNTGLPYYQFPFQYATVENIIFNDHLTIKINNKVFTKAELINHTLKLNDIIIFECEHNIRDSWQADLIIRMPVIIESATSEGDNEEDN